MKKAIVTGANGFVGRYLIAQLANLKYDIWAVVRNESENISFIEPYHPHIVNCDLADFAKLSTLIPTGTYECFYHLAWAGSSGSARADYALQLINAKACAEAAESAAGLGCKRFVGAGSITQLMYGDYLMQDGCQPEPVTQYAIAKTAGQNMARCICTEKKVDFLWGYISNLYGVGDVSQNIVNFLIKSYLDGKNTNSNIWCAGCRFYICIRCGRCTDCNGGRWKRWYFILHWVWKSSAIIYICHGNT